ncbi:SusC/RagA family TonB-linked outer membrane protein [Pedobacter rhizosphaerae]|uniref:TonB-linked outer membrane protein, SusC/RagA family n=1 Tax=Pedobacter rhizosphaerae TaxID=390241 RepID=A0A1H9ILK1_9SPHI|nr:TonB-dependent receptor [Pedobacter rhizosphaerae]SEQ75611.1 TonB-linked outer membrane protein, SusC/RagA family [Pedobacter rhizosphaerae]
MKKLLQSLFVLLFIASSVMAQDRTVSGTVTGKEDGLPLPGVSVRIKGASGGTTSGADGKYSIRVTTSASALEFSSVGYISQSISITGKNTINVSLASDAQSLTDVVVVGYGTAAKKDVIGSIAKVSGESLQNIPAPSFDRALAGKATGVQVITPSGLLGQAPQIRIRGINSITSGASPLYVVDGIPVISGDVGGFTSVNALADINSNDIESVEVLKDGAATAIYGSRAANGVVLITTKRGKSGVQFNYDGWTAIANISSRFDLLNADQFVTIANERFTNAGQTPQAKATPDGSGGFIDTDWQDAVFQQSVQQSHSVSASGGTDKTKYFMSLGFTDQKGAIVSNSLRKYSFRANLDQKITNFLTFGITSGVTYQKNLGPLAGSNNLSGNIFAATRMLPNVPVYSDTDITGYNISADRRSLGPGANLSPISDNIPNIRFVLDNNVRQSQTIRLIGSTYLEAKIFDGLKFKTQLGIDGSYIEDFVYTDPRHGDGFSGNGSMSQAYSPFFRWNWQNILSYTKSINGEHNIDVTLVSELQKQRSSFFQANVSNLLNIYFNQNITSGTFITPTVSGGLTLNGIESYLGRFNYNYKNKYYITGSIRRDALSSLPLNNRVGYFPGVGVQYRITEEDFFKNASGLSFISDLRLKASFAEVGNTDIGSFPYFGTYGAALYGNQGGIGFNNTGNPLLKWESQKKYDVGLDIGLLENRINLGLGYWKQDTKDLILAAPTAPVLGVPGNSISRNVGSMSNKGWEFSVNASVLPAGKVTWNTTLNFSIQKNVVTGLVDGNDIVGDYNLTRVGESIRTLYGYQYAGVNAANGNPLYVKADGSLVQGRISNTTYYKYDPANPNYFFNAAQPVSATNPDNRSSLTAADKVILGNSLPKWFGGFNNTITYGDFDLNVFLRFQGGNYIMNRTRQDLLSNNFVNNSTEVLGRWQSPENPGDGQMPRLWAARGSFINLDNNSLSRFVEKGDFLRMDNLALGYSLPSSILSKGSIKKVRVYASAQNLFVITGYKGLDPETNTTGAGVDFNGNPQLRTFTFGLNLGF